MGIGIEMAVVVVMVWMLGVVRVSEAAAAASASVAKAGCLEECGGVSIPYPFGVGSNCSAHNMYSVTCHHRASPPYLFLDNLDAVVLDISLSQSTLRLNWSVMSSNCPSRRNNDRQIGGMRLVGPYSYSDTFNRFTAMGCDNLATITQDGRLIGGCMSICNVTTSGAGSRGCYGVDCCQTTIPPSLQFFNVSLGSIENRGGSSSSSSSSSSSISISEYCKLAFMVDQEWFGNLSHPRQVSQMDFVPAVVDWQTYGHCQSFADDVSPSPANSFYSNITSLCGLHASCSNRTCFCNTGYQGNPYLPRGCQDIDECVSGQHYCQRGCVNKPGSYDCTCPAGHALLGKYDCFQLPGKASKNSVIIGTSTGFGVLLLLFCIWWVTKLVKKRRKIKQKQKFFKRNGGLLLQQQLSSDEGNVDKTKLFTSKELDKATDHYNDNRILGQGGQGTVYKGMLTDGRIVAVKKSKIVDEGKLGQFINEVVILSQINHRNVVKLHGCCLETQVPLLVYEFIPNGTLSEYIHNHNEEFPLSWEVRIRIATEVAGALTYLHSAASIPIYHRDIKSTNILLDDKYRAKVSDFGTSKSISVDQTHLTCTNVQGTFGYLDPEYFQSSQFTDKSDVYSFGVVLVELLTGQKPISLARAEQWRSLATYFILKMEENCVFEILDDQVAREGGKEEIMVVAKLAKRCLDLNGRRRPTMKEVAMELEGIRMSHGAATTIQQHHEEVEYTVGEVDGAWDFTSTSTASHLDASVSSTLDVQPLLF